MKKLSLNINSFYFGEVSSFASSLEQSCRGLHNMIQTPYNHIVRRPGSKHIQQVQHDNMRLFAFTHNDNSILITIYDETFAFYLNGKPIIDHNGQHHTLKTKWKGKDMIEDISFVFDTDEGYIFYIFSKTEPPMVLKFNENYYFNLNFLEIIDGPYNEINKSDIGLTLAGTSKSITINATGDVFKKNRDEGRLIRIAHNGLWGHAKITNIFSAKQVNANVIVPFNGTAESKDFRLGSWNIEDGYPNLATIFNGRLYCSTTNPNKKIVWASKSWKYNDFSPSTKVVKDDIEIDVVGYDNSMVVNITSARGNTWLCANSRNLLVGNKEGVFCIVPVAEDELLSPYNYQVKQLTTINTGSLATSVSSITFYNDINNSNILCSEILDNKLISNYNTTALSPHIFQSGIKDILYIDYPFSMLWVLLKDGSLATSTINYNPVGINNLDFIGGNIISIGNGGYTGSPTSYAWATSSISPFQKTQVMSLATNKTVKKQNIWLYVKRIIHNIAHYDIECISLQDFSSLYSYNNKVDNNIYLDSYRNDKITDNTFSVSPIFREENISLVLLDNKDKYISNLKTLSTVVILTGANSIYNDQEILYGYDYSSKFISHNLNPTGYNTSYKTKAIEDIILNTIDTKQLDIVCHVDNKQTTQITQVSSSNDYENGIGFLFSNISANFGYNLNLELQQNLPISLNIQSLTINMLIS